jgi:hypothetical protein
MWSEEHKETIRSILGKELELSMRSIGNWNVAAEHGGLSPIQEANYQTTLRRIAAIESVLALLDNQLA